MKHFFTLLLFMAFALSAQSQNTAIFSKVTATWCPNCGTWGWSFMEEMKKEYNGGEEALILGVHFSGNLQNDVSKWWAQNLKSVGQPQFFVNNNRINAGSSSWQSKITEVEALVTDFGASNNGITTFVNAYINGQGEIETNLVNQPIPTSENDQYFNIYVFENNVEDVQSGQSGMVMHPNVLRASLFDVNEGNLIPGGTVSIASPSDYNYTYTVDPNWNPENLGLLAVLWENENGSLVLKSAKAIKNIGRLSDVENTLNAEIFSVKTTLTEIKISSTDNNSYNYNLSDLSGKMVMSGSFNNNTTLSTEALVGNIYILNIQKEDKYFTQKVFIK